MKTTKNTELENLNGLSEKTSRLNYSEELEMHSVNDTPFVVARQNEDWFVIMGKHRLTNSIETFEEAVQEAEKITWNKVVQVIAIILENEKQLNK
jgi:hypothetical protein